MFSDSNVVRQFSLISYDIAMVQWNHKDVQVSRAQDVIVVTIAHARLRLYDLLDKLQERILYCDRR